MNANKKLSFHFDRRVGSNPFNCLSQSMICRYIEKYSGIIVRHLAPQYIRFPQTQDEIELTKLSFQRFFNFPGIVGIIDGTHVDLSSLRTNIEQDYVDRRGNHSINVQVICNANMIFTNVNARFPGASHDSFIYRSSQVNAFLDRLYHRAQDDFNFLIGNTTHFSIVRS